MIVVIAASLGGGGEDAPRGGSPPPGQAKQGGGKKKAPTSYVVQNGDTLTAISAKTGVSVSRIEALNPGVDPQILVSGEKLKLR